MAASSSSSTASAPIDAPSHIGGTWGEEEDSSNVWTGVSASTPMVSGVSAPVNDNYNHSVPSESDPWSDNTFSIWGSSTKVNNGNGVLAPNNVVNVSNFGGLMPTSSNSGFVNPSSIVMKRDNNTNPMNSYNMKSSSSSSASSSSASVSINTGTWGISQGGFNKNNEGIQPSGWDEDEESSRKRISPGSSGYSVDDGTAVWGKPGQHNKIARWIDPAEKNSKIPFNSANGNDAVS